MAKFWLVALFILGTTSLLRAQELNCVVKVDDQRAQTSDRNVFRDMEESFARFLNNRKWTKDEYTPEERIQCNLSITIEDMPAVGVFKSTVQIQSIRPVYNTNYSSLMFNFADRDWQFEYIESTPMDFGDNVYISLG